MNLFDCHLHSDFSFDSSENMENYIKKVKKNGDKYFITTEHMDLESNFNHTDIIPNFDLQQKKINELSQKYDMNILFGIEVGWRSDIHKRNMEIVRKYPFDMVILSIHESNEFDVSFPEFRQNKTTDECYNEYLELAYNAVSAFDDFDTFAHIDYVLRYIGNTDLSKHKEMLRKIFSVLIEKDKALEINTKLVPQPDAMARIEYIIRLYTSMGGKKVTIGSDAHYVKAHKNGFEETIELLKKYGIDHTYVFIGRKGIKIKI